MAALASPPPSPPIPSSPGSLSSASSRSASDSSNGTNPGPTSPPLLTYTSFGSPPKPKNAVPASVADSSAAKSSPASSVGSARPSRRTAGHRASHSMSRLGGPTAFPAGADALPPSLSGGGVSPASSLKRRGHRVSYSVNPPPSSAVEPVSRTLPSRSRTLSFSSSQQAFLPSAPRLAASTSSATLAFPSVEEGKVSSPTTLDRTPSTSSAATVPVRRPRPTRTSISTRSAQTLRVPGPSAGRPRRDEAPTDYLEAKVVILGSQGVGKTSLINRTTYGKFAHTHAATIGAQFHTKKLTVEHTRVHLQNWDPAGNERFRSMARLYYRGALAAVLVYDVTDESSLDDLQYWLGELRKEMSDEVVILVVGTKADLAGTYPTIPLEVAQRKIALWLHELDHPDDVPPPPSSSSTLRPPTPSPERELFPKPPMPRSQTFSAPSKPTSTFQSFPPSIVTTSPSGSSSRPHTPSSDARPSRARKQSSKVLPSSPAPLSSASSSRPPPPARGMSASATLPDLSGYTLASLNLASTHPGAHPPGPSPAQESLGMVRSSSGGAGPAIPSLPAGAVVPLANTGRGMVHSPTTPTLSLGAASRQLGLMSLSGLATVAGAGRRLSHDERMRREWEQFERERREREERDEERVRGIVDKCEVRVVEVSAKDGFGIEEIFYAIASQLITRKAEIEAARVLRSRDSIVLRDDDHIDTTKAGWFSQEIHHHLPARAPPSSTRNPPTQHL
ncbi:hypothetical protein JCM10207_005974 [Rhodosporidiobolus poonsookiae]